MPGKWVGGRGSLACPTKRQLIEAHVHDDEGRPQGTVFLTVKRLFGTGSTGRSILCDYVTASDPYYRWWVSTDEGVGTTVDGLYHLCSGDPTKCTGGGKDERVVHLGKWRTWTEAELTEGKAEHLETAAQEQLLRYFKAAGHRPRGAEPGGLPWEEGPLSIAKEDKKKGARPRGGDDDKEKERKKARMARLQQELDALRVEVMGSEDEAAKPKKKKKEERKGRPAAPGGGRSPRDVFKGAEVKGHMKPDRKGDEPESSSYGSEDEESDFEEPLTKREKEKERAIKKKAAAVAEQKKAKKDKQKRKTGRDKEGKRDKKPVRRAKDRGPFGVAPSEEWEERKVRKDDESHESGSSSDDSSFQKAPSSRSHHLKLVRYAKRYPGRLAARLLKRMESATGFGGGAETKPRQTGKPLQPVAHMYYLAIMTPHMRDRWTQRTQRELKVATTLLDLMVSGQGPEAADILAQRIKALEKSVSDNNQWF